MTSPYDRRPVEEWEDITRGLIAAHPLNPKELVEIVLKVWEDILKSEVGGALLQIGRDLKPKPQIMAFFLHALIPAELSVRYPKLWRGEQTGHDKDLVYIPDPAMSVEIKASSHPTQIFGNRSYAQKGSPSKKSKSGYYIAVNFGKFPAEGGPPRIARIRFGWLDHEDWAGQVAATGQQAHLSPNVERFKLLQLYP